MSLAVSGLAALALAQAASGPAPSVDTYLHMTTLGELGVSPDRRFAIVQTQAPAVSAAAYDDERLLEAQLSRLRIWRLDAPGRERSVEVAAVPGPLSPDGRFMAVSRVRGHQLQLGALALDSGRVRWLPAFVEPAGLGRAIAWRSSRDLVVLAPAKAVAPQLLQDGAESEARLIRLWRRQRSGRSASDTTVSPARALSDGPRRLRLVSLSSGRVRTLLSGAFTDFELSPDGETVALLEKAEPRAVAAASALTVSEHLRRTGLALFSMRDGKVRRPCAGDVLPTLLSWAPSSDAVLVATRNPQAFDWRMSRLVLATRDACRRLRLGAERPDVEDQNEERLPWIKAAWVGGTAVARLRADDGAARWAVLSLDRPPLGVPSPPPSSPSPFAAAARLALSAADASAPDGCAAAGTRPRRAAPSAVIVCSTSREDGVSEVWLSGSSHSRRLLTLNPTLARIRWARVTALRDGATVHWLYAPAQTREARPLVVLPYPGAASDTPPARYAPGASSLITQAQLLAAHGYAVLVPSLPAASPGRADAGIAEALLRAIDVAKRSERVDPCRIALWGHSFGGYAALVAAERSAQFSAVVAQNAPLDLLSFPGVPPQSASVFADVDPYLEFGYGWSEAGQGSFGAPPFRKSAAYLDASVTAHAEQLRAPLLLIIGDQDFVSAGQADELAAALRRRDRPVQLVTFWGEGHTLLSSANHRALYRQVFAFLDRAFAQPQARCPALAGVSTP